MKIPKKIEIVTSIDRGLFKRNRSRILEAIKVFEGKTIEVTFRLMGKQRSNNQNRYYWGVIVEIWANIFREEWGEIISNQEAHEFLKANCNYAEKVNESTGEILRMPISTTKNTTTDQEEFHLGCRQLAHEMFGIEIPLPNEQIQVKF